MTITSTNVSHPHIIKDPNICGGSPVIKGTRFPIRSVVYYVFQLGLTPEELIEKFPSLSMTQVYDALAYYYDNKEEVNQDIAENTEEKARSN
ncbi:MAG: hypothetical protein SCARUB_04593 [Candidatus Scalindua rubra]|uniref:DUF433 domain-containing protein n=1 Tax=Candidatus Scalindua rubra TaxID=1872076 RepID=A0A1E3X3Q5_9BACT|nr:MAG: hypothetical protein SCARUB_04593 [Candidatus Scalindua rubra]